MPGPRSRGERTLVGHLAPLAQKDMLVLADSGFYSWDLLDSYTADGVDLLWRVEATVQLPPVRALPDGPYTALVFSPRVQRPARERLLAQARAGHSVGPDRPA